MSSSSGVLREFPPADGGSVQMAVLSGIDAVVQIPVLQHRADAAAGLRTAALLSGYPGSPLGTVDLALERQAQALAALDITHVPGLNEELAATIVWGTQQGSLMADSPFDGVVGIWYGKSPGVDRCGDVFKHANSMGSAANGGALVVAGDDPSAKSSTLPNDSRIALFDAQIPILLPSSVPEIMEFGLHGIAVSRYSGLWTGLKIVTDLADGFASVDVQDLIPSIVVPRLEVGGRPWQHVQRPTVNNTVSVLQEEEIVNGRLEAAKAYALANGLNRITHAARDAWLGIVVGGKTFADVLQALAELGLDAEALERGGVRILKVGMAYPLEPTVVREFAAGLEQVLVVEEKRPFVEMLIREVLYDMADRPRVVGKRDEEGRLLVPGDGELTPQRLRPILRDRLALRLDALAPEPVDAAPAPLVVAPPAPRPSRVPVFCSGCPHNRSTAPTEGIVGGGVGCHAMVYLEERHHSHALLPLTPMGAEGVMWIGAHRFVAEDHMVQNLGDGTLAHSGSLAIRASVAAGVNITFKILFNRAIAMTGGQDVAGAVEVPALSREFEAMGVRRTIVVADEPGKYGEDARWAPGVEVWGRDRLPDAEIELARTPGVTALIYDQRCAAESRRLRKRGKLPTPATRVVINEAVCEGCGDCQVKSNCLSVQPVDTPLGRKTRIHQSSCNQDLSCLDGDCPSFVTVDATTVRERERTRPQPPSDLPAAVLAEVNDEFSSYMVGVGGTGVVTVNRLLGSAALRDGWTVSGLDQTGLSQKGGSVVSHLRASRHGTPAVNTVADGACDVYFAFDPLAAAEPRHLARASSARTLALVSTDVAPTISVITQPRSSMPGGDSLADAIRPSVLGLESQPAESICEELFGDHMPSHVFMVGVAHQLGALPLSLEALEGAIGELGNAETNLAAFRWGRAAVCLPEALTAARSGGRTIHSSERSPSVKAEAAGERMLAGVALPQPTLALASWRVKDLIDYQDEALARRYLDLVMRAAAAEQRIDAQAPADGPLLSETVARQLYKLLAYKDEYEVARLHLDAAFAAQLDAEFPRAKVAFRLHPPALRAMGLKRKLAIPAWIMGPGFKGLMRLRRLRGTALDPFGRAEVRKVERRLIEEYIGTLDRLLTSLSDADHGLVVELAALPERVRGYEDVKLRNVIEYDRERARLLEEIERIAT